MSVAVNARSTAKSADLHLVATPARRQTSPLPSASQLREALPLSAALARQVQQQRHSIRAILDGHDPRLLVVVGPCSLHDDAAVLEYAERLAALSERVGDRLLLVMRAYVEKPRTSVGWKGLDYDPALDGSGDMAAGLRRSRHLMLRLLELGLPLASEILQPLVAGYFDDLLGWAAIGARTSESQVHRELVSGLEMPVGFKNGTDGSLGIACDAMRSAAHPHQHFGVDGHGHPALVQTQGNPDTHLVLRGGHGAPNYDAASIARARAGALRPNASAAARSQAVVPSTPSGYGVESSVAPRLKVYVSRPSCTAPAGMANSILARMFVSAACVGAGASHTTEARASHSHSGSRNHGAARRHPGAAPTRGHRHLV
mgnify:CR=1 FL=1